MDKPILFEFLGSFAICFFGSFMRINNVDDFVTIAIGFFLIYFGVISLTKIYSGAILNPVLTISLTITDSISKSKVVGYLAA